MDRPAVGGLARSSSPQSAAEAGFESCPLLFESPDPGKPEDGFGDFRDSRLKEGDPGPPCSARSSRVSGGFESRPIRSTMTPYTREERTPPKRPKPGRPTADGGAGGADRRTGGPAARTTGANDGRPQGGHGPHGRDGRTTGRARGRAAQRAQRWAYEGKRGGGTDEPAL